MKTALPELKKAAVSLEGGAEQQKSDSKRESVMDGESSEEPGTKESELELPAFTLEKRSVFGGD